jgi:hypothetical protein
METLARLLIAAVVTVGLLASAATAHAETTPGVDFELTLSERTPAAPTSMSLRIRYKDPRDAEAKPPSLKEVRIIAPDGLRFDGGAVAACTADDAALRLQGGAACAPGSRLGSGTVVVMTGCGPLVDPFALNLTPYNSGAGILELVTLGSQAVLAVERTRFSAPNEIKINPPSVPACPVVSVREAQLTVAGGAPARPYVTTPPHCPASGLWTSRVTVSYVGDATPYTASSTTPCVRPVTQRKATRRCVKRAAKKPARKRPAVRRCQR